MSGNKDIRISAVITEAMYNAMCEHIGPGIRAYRSISQFVRIAIDNELMAISQEQEEDKGYGYYPVSPPGN